MIDFLRRLLRGPDTLASIDRPTYQRWLEAGRPPLAEFCRRPDDEQDTLALMGLQHERGRALAIAKALHNPKLWEAEHFGDDDELEEAVHETMAQALYAEYLGAGVADPAPSMDRPARSMGQAVREFDGQQDRDRTTRARRTRSAMTPATFDTGEARA